MKRKWKNEELAEHGSIDTQERELILQKKGANRLGFALLLQVSLVYINTLLIHQVLSEPAWMQQMGVNQLRALTPLVYAHVNPYGVFRLNLTERLPIESLVSSPSILLPSNH